MEGFSGKNSQTATVPCIAFMLEYICLNCLLLWQINESITVKLIIVAALIILVLGSIQLFWCFNFGIFASWTNIITNTISNICNPFFLQRCRGGKINEIQRTQKIRFTVHFVHC